MALPVAFYFKVRIGLLEVAFKEVSGLSTEMEIGTLQEGGVNSYVHHLPKQIKHTNLVLKRALQPVFSADVIWIKSILECDFLLPIVPVPVIVSLLNEEGAPLYSWMCLNAFPVKWDVDSMESEKTVFLLKPWNSVIPR